MGQQHKLTVSDSRKRTLNYVRQISGSVVYKSAAVGASFLAFPLMIGYLGQEQFGVWATLLSVMTWIVFFDLGVGNGLRNAVANALAKSDTNEAAKYVASAYTIVGLIALTMWACIIASSFFIPWQSFFNTTAIPELVLRFTVQISVSFIILNFWLGLVSALFAAVQKTSLISFGQMITSLMMLAIVFLLSKTHDPVISRLALSYGISILTANIILSIIFFKNRRYLLTRPILDKEHLRPLLHVGLQFFIIQIAVLVIFTTDKLLITHIIGPVDVTEYEVVFRLFSLISLAHGLISGPLWSAYTEAYSKNDWTWIKLMLKKQILVFFGLVIITVFLVFLAKSIITVWVGEEIRISDELIITIALFVIVAMWNNIFAMFVNGIGKIRLQLFTSILAMFINIPLSITFASYFGWGTSGIVMGTICSLMIAAVALPLQVHFLMSKESPE